VNANAVVDMAADWQRGFDARADAIHAHPPTSRRRRSATELARQYVSAQPEQSSETKATEQYVTKWAGGLQRMRSASSTIVFHLIGDANVINAFALPGGHVFIGRGFWIR